jgi:hypothetical protein
MRTQKASTLLENSLNFFYNKDIFFVCPKNKLGCKKKERKKGMQCDD